MGRPKPAMSHSSVLQPAVQLTTCPARILPRLVRTVSTRLFLFFQAEDGIRDLYVTGVQTCALPISPSPPTLQSGSPNQSERAQPKRRRRRQPHKLTSVVLVLVTGGTGAVGSEVVKRLRAAGHRARVLSRKPGKGEDWVQGDIATGAGLELAVKDADAIVHAASDATHPRRYQATDVLGTRRVVAMAREAGVRHVVYVSIVGMEGVGYPYYKGKLAAEAVIRENLIPWSFLRATQFHTLMEIFLGYMTKVPWLATVPFAW